MKNVCKKALTLLLALTMVMTMSLTAMAAGETISIVLSTDSVYCGTGVEDFQVTFVLNTDMESIAGVQFVLTYDEAVIAPSDGNGTKLTTWNDSVLASALPSTHTLYAKTITDTEAEGDGKIAIMLAKQNPMGSDTIPVSNGSVEVISLNFTAIAEGETTIGVDTTGVTQVSTAAGTTLTLDSSAYPTPKTVTVLPLPNEPTITAATITDEDGDEVVLRAGDKAIASYEWNNGNTGIDADTTTDDVSVINWTVGGEAVTKLETDERDEITLKPEWVGQQIAYSVVPKADRPADLNNNVTEAVSSMGEFVVKAATGYTLTADVNTDIENDEIIATLPATVLVALDDTYPEEAVVNGTTYAWYILPLVTEGDDYTVETAKLATLEGVPASTAATATFSPENRDQWVVVVVTPKATIAGEEFTAEAVKFAAKITGEPPVLDDVADGSALAAKKLYTNTLMTITENQVKFISNAVGDDASIDYTYNWYLATSAEDEAPVEITGDAILKDGAQIRLGKVADAEGKYLVLVVTGTDALGISSSVEIFFENAIAKASNASGTAGGASLSAGGVVVPPTEEPGDEPGTDEPAGNEDPSGDAIANGAAAFTDVDKEAYAWAYEGIDTLAKAGVIKGMTETTFGPELTATNAQMIALAVRIAGLTAENATTDKVDAEHWVAEEAAIAEAKGILGVYGDKVAVEEAVSREVAFTLLYNALKAAGVELPETAEAIEFTDAASIDANCVEAINALVKAGIVNGMGDGTLAPKATLTRAQLAKILGLANALITK